MSLLCALGRHRAGPRPRWNDGYYFSTCRRCGRDLVRTAFEGWKVPTGYKVVWSHKPPENRPSAALAPEPPARESAPEPPAPQPLPSESMPEEPLGSEPVEAATASPPAPSVISRTAPARQRSIFTWADPQTSPSRKQETPASNMSIGEVLRILREEEEEEEERESRADTPSDTTGEAVIGDRPGPDAPAEDAPPEGGTIAGGPEPLELVLGQVEPEAPGPPAETGEEALHAREETVANEGGETILHSATTHSGDDAAPAEAVVESGPEGVPPPFDDFMDEPESGDGGSDFWSPPADSRNSGAGPAADAAEPPPATLEAAPAGLAANPLAADPLADHSLVDDSLADDPLTDDLRAMPEPQPSAPSAGAEVAQAHDDPVAETRDRLAEGPAHIDSPEQERQAPVRPGADGAGERKSAPMPAADPGEAPAPALPVVTLPGGGRRNRARSRMGLRIAIGALTLATAFIVTKVSGFEIEELAPRSGIETGESTAGPAYVVMAPADCRAAPTPGARALRQLPRGQEVRVLAREPGWTSVEHPAGQCWVAERSLSAEPPR